MQGVIDIGSNSMRLSLYRIDGRKLIPLYSKKVMAGLGAHVDSHGNLSQEGMDIALDALLQFRTLLAAVDNPPVEVIATASLRNVGNTEAAVDMLESNTGFTINILSGKDEAHADYVGVRYAMANNLVVPTDEFLMVDIGGGSTELVLCKQAGPVFEVSLPVGSLNQYARHVDYLIPAKSERRAIRTEVETHVDKHKNELRRSVATIVGVGGSVRYALKLYNDHFMLGSKNRHMHADRIKELLKTFKPSSKVSLQRLLRIAPDRVHTLIPGMEILRTIIEVTNAQSVAVSDFGVREGYIIERLGLEG